MRSYNCDDHKKFMYALCARDIRRLAAMVDRANLDADIRVEMDSALEQLEARLFRFAFADDATGTLVGDVDRYSDGRPVTTTIDWGGAFATLVHSPHPNDETGGEAEDLAEEFWPAGADDPGCNPLETDRQDDVD